MSTSLRLRFPCLQCREARIFPPRAAQTRAAIEVPAADRTESAAVLAAQRLHRQREIELLAHQLSQVNLLVLIERRRQVVFLDLALALAGVAPMRLVPEIERLIDRRL